MTQPPAAFRVDALWGLEVCRNMDRVADSKCPSQFLRLNTELRPTCLNPILNNICNSCFLLLATSSNKKLVVTSATLKIDPGKWDGQGVQFRRNGKLRSNRLRSAERTTSSSGPAPAGCFVW